MNRVLADYLQVWGAEENALVFSDGSLGMGFEVTPIDVSCSAEQEINELNGKLSVFVNSLPSGLDVQFVQDIEPGNESTIVGHESLRDSAGSAMTEELRSARSRQLRDLDRNGNLPKHSLRMFVRKPFSSKLIQTPTLFRRAKQFEPLAEHRLSEELAGFERVASDLAGTLDSIGTDVRRMKTEEVVSMIYDQWNPQRKVPLHSYDPDDIRSSLLFTDAGIYERGFSLADIHHRIISLKLLPERTFASMAAALRELPFGSRLFLTFNVPDQQKELEKLQTQRRIAFAMVTGKRTGVSDIESQAKLNDLEQLIEEMVAAGEKVFRVSLNVLLRSNNEELLNEMVAKSLQVIRELAGADAMEESLASFDIFSQLSLPNARCSERTKYIKSSNLVDFLPVYGPWLGHKVPRLLLRSRLGSLVRVDPFSPDLTNANQIIVGSSGSGKSFLTNVLLMQTFKENPQIFIVDIGGSYKKLTENLDGQYVSLGIDSGLALNPFDLPDGDLQPSNQKVKFLLGLVELMTKEADSNGLGRLERAEIESAIEQVYQECARPCFSDLKRCLSAHTDPKIRQFARVLAPWCGKTPYGSFVDHETNIELRKSIVSFDLKGMESFPDLQAVVLSIITDFLWREVQKDKSRMKFLVLDECWKLLETESGAALIAEVFRTFRKYYASAIAISQNIDDFARSKVAAAILTNSSTKWILKQKGTDKARLKAVLSLNDTEVSLTESLTQKRGHYAEALLMLEDRHFVAIIEPTPIEYWNATSSPVDTTIIEQRKLIHPNSSNTEILSQLAHEYPNGFTA